MFSLAHKADPALWAQETLDFYPDPHQAEVLRCPSPRLLLCCTRQWGKSTLAALRLLHFSAFQPKSLSIIVSASERQSGLLIATIGNYLETLAIPIQRDPRATPSLRLPNGSALIALPACPTTVRGFASVGFLVIDEAAYVPDALYHAVRPMLAVSRGTLWLLSTPDSQRGFFYQEYYRALADPAYLCTRFVIPASECPRMSADFLAAERQALGESIFNREYNCEFAAPAGQIITRALLDACLTDQEEPFDWP